MNTGTPDGSHQYRQGEHICGVYEDRAEQLAMAAAFLSDGILKKEQCLYVDGSPAALDEFRQVIGSFGVNTAAEEQRSALLLKTKGEAHLVDGRFDCERMLSMLNGALEQALNAGFSGLRTCGDMTWLLDDAPGSEQVVEYEAMLNQFFQNARGLGMCQYDRNRLPLTVVDHALATHPVVELARLRKDNSFYRPADIAVSRKAQSWDVGWKLRELARH